NRRSEMASPAAWVLARPGCPSLHPQETTPMEPEMTVTLTVHTRGDDKHPGLLVTLYGGEKFNIPLTETPETIAGLVRDLADLVPGGPRRAPPPPRGRCRGRAARRRRQGQAGQSPGQENPPVRMICPAGGRREQVGAGAASCSPAPWPTPRGVRQ